MKILISFLIAFSFGNSQIVDSIPYPVQYTGDWPVRLQSCQKSNQKYSTYCTMQLLKDSTFGFSFTMYEMTRSEAGFFVTDPGRFENIFGTYSESVFDSNGVYYVIAKKDIYYSIGRFQDGILIHSFIEEQYLDEFYKMLFLSEINTSIKKPHLTSLWVNRSSKYGDFDILGRAMFDYHKTKFIRIQIR